MSTTAALQDLDFDVIVQDGVPVEKTIHLLTMMLFRHLVQIRLRELGPDFYVGADQFVYYSKDQARDVAREVRQLELFKNGERPDKPEETAFRGPDVFVVQHVSSHERDAWISWEEGDRLPDLILELLSPSTAKDDYGAKKRLYQDVFQSSEYFLYEPRGPMVDGYRLLDHTYQNIPRSPEGRLWSRLLQVEVGVWHGEYESTEGPWLRLFYPDGSLVLTEKEQERLAKEAAVERAEQERLAKEAAVERAEQERLAKEQERLAKEAAVERAEQERLAKEQERLAKEAAAERADAAEIELARLRARLAELEGQDD